MSEIELCRRPGADSRTRAQKQEALLLAAFRCAGKKGQVKLLKQAMKALRSSAAASLTLTD